MKVNPSIPGDVACDATSHASGQSGGSNPAMGGIYFSTHSVQLIPPEIQFSDAAVLHPKRPSPSGIGTTKEQP